jgi:hypothetical protein
MKHLKEISLLIREFFDKNKKLVMPLELHHELELADKYLTTTKALEYKGQMKMPYTALKLIELGMDFDDVIKEIFNKRNDIEFDGELYLIVNDKVETKVV